LSARFAVMPVIIAMLMASMSGSLLVAFGLLACLRGGAFPQRAQDTRDTSYILWVIMEGLAIGNNPVFHGGHLSSRHWPGIPGIAGDEFRRAQSIRRGP
jgi:hypothetical protein